MNSFFRLKTSNKKTRWPKALLENIEQALSSHFSSKKGRFIVDGLICPEEFGFKIGYIEKDEIRQNNFHISKDFSFKNEKSQETIELLIDYGLTLISYYFENSHKELPRSWSEQEFHGNKLFFLFSTENDSLEKQANQLLNISEDELLIQEDEILDDTSEELQNLQVDELFKNLKNQRDSSVH